MSLKEQVNSLMDHYVFVEKYLGRKVYGFKIGKRSRKERNDTRYYATKRYDGKQYSVYISQNVSDIETLKSMVKDKIEKNFLPASLIDKGVE